MDPSIALFLSDDKKTCVSIMSAEVTSQNFMLIDDDSPYNGFEINNHDTQLAIVLKCNRDAATPVINFNNMILSVESASSCGYNNEPARFVDLHSYVVAIPFALLGLVLLFFGGYKWRIMVEASGFVFGVVLVYSVFWLIWTGKSNTVPYVITTLVAVIVGALLGFLCRIASLLSYVLFGFGAGYTLTRYLLVVLSYRGHEVNLLAVLRNHKCGSRLRAGRTLCVIKAALRHRSLRNTGFVSGALQPGLHVRHT